MEAKAGVVKTKQRRLSREARRRQIMDAAIDIFSRKGYSGTTTKEIARAIGASEAILFRHFASKDELYTAILDDLLPRTMIDTYLQKARELAARRADFELFYYVSAGFLRCYREEKILNRLLMRAAIESHGLARPLHLRTIVPIMSFLREYIIRRQAEGAFCIVDPEPYAIALIGLPTIVGYWRDLFDFDPIMVSDDALAARFTQMLLGTLVRRPKDTKQNAVRKATSFLSDPLENTDPASPTGGP